MIFWGGGELKLCNLAVLLELIEMLEEILITKNKWLTFLAKLLFKFSFDKFLFKATDIKEVSNVYLFIFFLFFSQQKQFFFSNAKEI